MAGERTRTSHGVADEVEYNLREAHVVAHLLLGHARADIQHQRETCAAGTEQQHVSKRAHAR
jgi:hypothetical protein